MPTADKLIAVLFAAFDAFVANLIVDALSKITKYAAVSYTHLRAHETQ